MNFDVMRRIVNTIEDETMRGFMRLFVDMMENYQTEHPGVTCEELQAYFVNVVDEAVKAANERDDKSRQDKGGE